MYECPNCAGNLKFHIKKQMLHCEHCETTMDPYAFHKEQDAEENQYFEVTVFRCPQCGGEILSDDNTAATFCSFCGASTILDSRISKEKRPKYIIPFMKTKEDCRESYEKFVRHAFFAPKELKDKNAIEHFRGIYMPYWVYSYHKEDTITFMGNQTSRMGDYQIIQYFNLTSDVIANYKGITYDASSSFADNLSDAIAPFDISAKKPFTPAFLSGFYADSNDVDDEYYFKKAHNFIMNDIFTTIQNDPSCSQYDFESTMNRPSLRRAMTPEKIDAALTMLPVWFLTYRKKDRVAYAVINGQTGKAVADLPIDGHKYLKYSLLLSLPIILILCLCNFTSPIIPLYITILLISYCTIIANNVTNEFLFKESCDDTGLEEEEARQEEKKKTKNKKISFQLKELIAYSVFIIYFILFQKNLLSVISSILAFIVLFFPFAGIYSICCILIELIKKRTAKSISHTNLELYEINWRKKFATIIKPIIALFLTITVSIVAFFVPQAILGCYIGILFCIFMMYLTILDLIKYHNIMSTHKLPQLNKRGGEENA